MGKKYKRKGHPDQPDGQTLARHTKNQLAEQKSGRNRGYLGLKTSSFFGTALTGAEFNYSYVEKRKTVL